MARKKNGLSARMRGVTLIGLATVIGVGLVTVFGFGLGLDFVRPQQNADALEIPIPTQQEEQIIDDLSEENQVLINDEINPLIDCVEFSAQVDSLEAQQFCTDQLDQMIKEFEENEMKINEIVPDPINQTEFSEDPPITQIGDETENPILPQSPSLQILLNVVKIDSDGISTESTTNFDLPPFAFLVQEETDRDFRTGFLDFDPFLKGDPNSRYIGQGTVDVLVSNQTIFTEPVKIQFDGITDPDGLLKIDFLTPAGAVAKIINLDFDKNFNKFTNEAITPIIFKIIELEITDPTSMVFSIIDQEIFRMNIARDDFKIIVSDEQGGTQRIYNIDSKLIIQGVPTKVIAISCYIFYTTIHNGNLGTTVVQYRSDPTHPLGCIKEIAPKTYVHSTQNTNVFGITLFDSNGQFIKSIAGGTGIVVDELLSRNTNYTLTIASPMLEANLSYPKAQQTKSFTCSNEYDIKYTTKETNGSKRFRTYSTSWQYTTLVVQQVDVKDVICNFKEVTSVG